MAVGWVDIQLLVPRQKRYVKAIMEIAIVVCPLLKEGMNVEIIHLENAIPQCWRCHIVIRIGRE